MVCNVRLSISNNCQDPGEDSTVAWLGWLRCQEARGSPGQERPTSPGPGQERPTSPGPGQEWPTSPGPGQEWPTSPGPAPQARVGSWTGRGGAARGGAGLRQLRPPMLAGGSVSHLTSARAFRVYLTATRTVQDQPTFVTRLLAQ